MTTERWRRVSEIFQGALERSGAERDAFIVDACGGDDQLRVEVASLLAGHARAGDARFIESPAFENDPDLLLEVEAFDAPLVGQTVGAYRILREIGRGGMGIVYQAEDVRLGRIVALKALPPQVAADEARRERLRREARAAAALSHPAVAVVYALEEIDGALFIASEYIEGRSLRDELRDGPLAPPTVVSTAKAIASALAAAHARGIVHRDLKPENVMRARDGQVKVLDFGLARVIDDRHDSPTAARITVAGAIVGTPGYMAPEQLEGRPADARADVYAFGVLVHELATGALPGAVGLSGRPASPFPLERIAARCLQRDPAERFPSGGELLAALESDVPPPAPPAPAVGATARWWWQFHQIAIAMFHAALLVVVWAARGWLDRPWRAIALYGAVAAATADVTMRLNLWFASRVHPRTLAGQRARLIRALLAADACYALILCVLAAAGAQDHERLSALLLTGAIVSLLSLLVIEPTTARAAFLPRKKRRSSEEKALPRLYR